jgi:hypothetical protein
MTSIVRGSALACAGLLLIASNASAQSVRSPFNPSRLNALTVALGCRIENTKEIVVTNTTSATIAAGTTISYDAIRYGSTLHYGGTHLSPALAPGASFRFGGDQSSSCTASYRRLPVAAQ